jgi:hypothetical protein
LWLVSDLGLLQTGQWVAVVGMKENVIMCTLQHLGEWWGCVWGWGGLLSTHPNVTNEKMNRE